MIEYFEKAFQMDYNDEPDYEIYKLILRQILSLQNKNKYTETITFKKNR